ncbi:MAG: class II aldolase/adducin family protein, partial [Halobacteriaceae archaeon]
MTIPLEAERTKVSELGKEMLEQGLTKGTGGNISARKGDQVAISPSGVPYKEITPEDVPIVDLEGNHVAGEKDPSSEIALHTGILRERD